MCLFKERRLTICCPKCKCELIARDNDKIICLSSECDWSTKAKRLSDNSLLKKSELK